MVLVRKFRPVKLNFRTYHPKKRVEIEPHKILSPLAWIGMKLAQASDFFFFIFSGIFLGIKAFLGIKHKVREAEMRREKLVILREKKYPVNRNLNGFIIL